MDFEKALHAASDLFQWQLLLPLASFALTAVAIEIGMGSAHGTKGVPGRCFALIKSRSSGDGRC